MKRNGSKWYQVRLNRLGLELPFGLGSRAWVWLEICSNRTKVHGSSYQMNKSDLNHWFLACIYSLVWETKHFIAAYFCHQNTKIICAKHWTRQIKTRNSHVIGGRHFACEIVYFRFTVCFRTCLRSKPGHFGLERWQYVTHAKKRVIII